MHTYSAFRDSKLLNITGQDSREEAAESLIKPNLDENIRNSNMHSHCFVRFEKNYTPIGNDEERLKYLAIPCFKGVEEVKQFYKDISTSSFDEHGKPKPAEQLNS